MTVRELFERFHGDSEVCFFQEVDGDKEPICKTFLTALGMDPYWDRTIAEWSCGRLCDNNPGTISIVLKGE